MAGPVEEAVERLPVAERERVAEETVPLVLAVGMMEPEGVAEAWTLEAMLEIRLETDEAEAEAAELREEMTEETDAADEAEADEAAEEEEPPVRPNWPE